MEVSIVVGHDCILKCRATRVFTFCTLTRLGGFNTRSTRSNRLMQPKSSTNTTLIRLLNFLWMICEVSIEIRKPIWEYLERMKPYLFSETSVSWAMKPCLGIHGLWKANTIKFRAHPAIFKHGKCEKNAGHSLMFDWYKYWWYIQFYV